MKTIGNVIGESYRDLLGKDEWMEFSKSIRETRNECEACRIPKSKGVQLHVHHLFYDFDRKPWEYDATEVVVLCSNCHQGMHDQLKQFRKHVFRHLKPRTFQVLNGALAVALTKYDPLTFVHALAEIVSNERLIQNHAAAWSKQSP